MKARLLKATALEQLRASIATNLDVYRSGNFDYLEADPSFSFDHHVDIDLEALASLKAPAGNSYYEVENCEILHSALQALSPYDARDERLWVYLSHTALLDHARRRWPIPDDDAAAVGEIACKRERDGPARRLGCALHDGQILFVDAAGTLIALHRRVDLGHQRHDDQARGVLVETRQDARLSACAAAHAPQHDVEQRA